MEILFVGEMKRETGLIGGAYQTLADDGTHAIKAVVYTGGGLATLAAFRGLAHALRLVEDPQDTPLVISSDMRLAMNMLKGRGDRVLKVLEAEVQEVADLVQGFQSITYVTLDHPSNAPTRWMARVALSMASQTSLPVPSDEMEAEGVVSYLLNHKPCWNWYKKLAELPEDEHSAKDRATAEADLISLSPETRTLVVRVVDSVRNPHPAPLAVEVFKWALRALAVKPGADPEEIKTFATNAAKALSMTVEMIASTEKMA